MVIPNDGNDGSGNESWLQSIGLHSNPFTTWRAEHMLLADWDRLWLQPDCYDALLLRGYSTAVFGIIGSGKSTLCYQLERKWRFRESTVVVGMLGNNSRPLTVTLKNPGQHVELSKSSLGLKNFISLIISSVAAKLFRICDQHPAAFRALSNAQKNFLVRLFWHHYKDAIQNAYMFNSFTNELKGLKDMGRIPLFEPHATLEQILTALQQQIQKLGFTQLMFLVDDTGISNATIDAHQQRIALLLPLLTYTSLFQLPNVIWKFFLDANLSELKTEIRRASSHIDIEDLIWSEDQLLTILDNRMMYAGAQDPDKIPPPLDTLYDAAGEGNPDTHRPISHALVQNARTRDGVFTPNALLRLGRILVDEMEKLWRQSGAEGQILITPTILRRVIARYQESISAEE